MHPLLKQTKTVDQFGYTHRGVLPIQGATSLWPTVIKNVPIKPSKSLVDEVNKNNAEEQRLVAAVNMEHAPHAQANYDDLLQQFIDSVENGLLSAESEFPHSPESRLHDFKSRNAALNVILARKIAKNRAPAKKLVEAIIPPIREARVKYEADEVSRAKNWGQNVEFSEATKILASIEQHIENTIEDWKDIPECNPNRSVLLDLLPPGIID